jgi:hypothetical protein
MAFFRLQLFRLPLPALIAAGALSLVATPSAYPKEIIRLGYALQFENRSGALPALIERGLHLHEKPQGQQVFTLVQLSRFGRFREEDFAGTRDLVALAKKAANSGG